MSPEIIAQTKTYDTSFVHPYFNLRFYEEKSKQSAGE